MREVEIQVANLFSLQFGSIIQNEIMTIGKCDKYFFNGDIKIIATLKQMTETCI